jgi:hypothetical protein
VTNELTSKVQRLWPEIVAGCEADLRHDVQSYFEFGDRLFQDFRTIPGRDYLFADKEMTDELLETIRRSKSSILRILAANLLGHLILFHEDAELADRIIDLALEKQSPPTYPSRFLSALPDKIGSLEKLIPLLDSKSSDVREYAARLLASVDFPEKKETFERVLRNDERNHEVITVALWELGSLANETTAPLVKPYLTDKNEFWQNCALTCLETALGARGCEIYAALLSERKFRNKINATRALIEYCGINEMSHLTARFRNTLRAKEMSCDRDGRSERTILLEFFWEHRDQDDAQKLIDAAKKKKEGFYRREIAYLEESGSELAAYLLG